MSKNQEFENVNEGDLIQGILAAVSADESYVVDIPRNGKIFLSFRIRPLSEAEFQHCREQNTRYKAAKQYGGIKLPEKTDTVGYRSALIIAATVEEDRKKLWNNPKLLEGLHVIRATEAVDKILRSGEKDRLVERIEEISGYTDADDDDYMTAEETAKN